MNTATLKFGLAALVMFAVSSAIVIEHQDCETLGASRESLRQQIARLKTDNENLSNLVEQGKKSAPLSTEQFNELLRLRGEAGMLRDQTNEIARLQRENQQFLSDPAAHSEFFSQLSPADQFVLRQTHVGNAMMTLVNAARNYAVFHHGQNPTSFGQLTNSGLLQISNFPGDLSLDDFEFLKPAVTADQGQILILRARVPIPKPGENPVWVYGSIDGRGGVMTTSANFANEGP